MSLTFAILEKVGSFKYASRIPGLAAGVGICNI